MGTRYPVRKSQSNRSQGAANFQRPRPVQLPYDPPANDNKLPANDNYTRPQRRGSFAGVARNALKRGFGWGIAAGFGYELWRWTGQQEADLYQPGWAAGDYALGLNGWESCGSVAAIEGLPCSYFPNLGFFTLGTCSGTVSGTQKCRTPGSALPGPEVSDFTGLTKVTLWFWGEPVVDNYRGRAIETYTRADGSSAQGPDLYIGSENFPAGRGAFELPLELPEVSPMLDPEVIVPGQPAPQPQPIPYRVSPDVGPNPDRHPRYQPRRGPRPAVRPRPIFTPSPRPGLPDLLVSPAPAPGHGPTVEVNPPPLSSRSPRVGSAGGFSGSPPHSSQPPGKRTRERKTLASPKAAAWVRFALSNVTEGLDALNALWDALPPWAKTMVPGERTTPQQMARDLWNAAGRDDIDWGQFAADAVENLIKEQLSDYLFGTIGQVAGKAGRSNGWLFGPQTGPWDNQRRPQGREDEAQIARKEL